MARKGWDDLSPDYRKRLIKGGVTESRYNAGAPLHKARGHKSKRVESEHRQLRRLAAKQGLDPDEVQEVIDEIGYKEALDILTFRDMALNPTDDFERTLAYGSMRNLFGQYEGLVPREWLYYHGKK